MTWEWKEFQRQMWAFTFCTEISACDISNEFEIEFEEEKNIR